MEDFGKNRKEFLRNFLEFPNGIPNSDTFRRVYNGIDSLDISYQVASSYEMEIGVYYKNSDVKTVIHVL